MAFGIPYNRTCSHPSPRRDAAPRSRISSSLSSVSAVRPPRPLSSWGGAFRPCRLLGSRQQPPLRSAHLRCCGDNAGSAPPASSLPGGCPGTAGECGLGAVVGRQGG
eukprot:scaffold6397_cov121-Isochrysis_galbana.AAC.13